MGLASGLWGSQSRESSPGKPVGPEVPSSPHQDTFLKNLRKIHFEIHLQYILEITGELTRQVSRGRGATQPTLEIQLRKIHFQKYTWKNALLDNTLLENKVELTRPVGAKVPCHKTDRNFNTLLYPYQKIEII